MPPKTSPPGDPRIPQIDFQKIFTTLGEAAPGSSQKCEVPSQSDVCRFGNEEGKTTTFGETVQFSLSEWANIIFVAATLGGGLFCALYFFDHPEVSRRTASWPREFLYQPPVARPETVRIETIYHLEPVQGPLTFNLGRSAPDSFTRNTGLTNTTPTLASATPAGGYSSNSGTGVGSSLGGPGQNTPGSDALSQALNQGAADVARARELDAHRTVVVMNMMKNHSSKVERRMMNHSKQIAQGASRAETKLAARGRSFRNGRDFSQKNNARENRGLFAGIRSGSGAGQRGMSSMRSMTSRPGAGFTRPGSLHVSEHAGGGRGGHGGGRRGGRIKISRHNARSGLAGYICVSLSTCGAGAHGLLR